MQNKFGANMMNIKLKLLTRNKMSIFSNSDLDFWRIPKCIPNLYPCSYYIKSLVSIW